MNNLADTICLLLKLLHVRISYHVCSLSLSNLHTSDVSSFFPYNFLLSRNGSDLLQIGLDHIGCRLLKKSGKCSLVSKCIFSISKSNDIEGCNAY